LRPNPEFPCRRKDGKIEFWMEKKGGWRGGGCMDFILKFSEMREKGNFLPDMEINGGITCLHSTYTVKKS
jgi:hypothetical protein